MLHWPSNGFMWFAFILESVTEYRTPLKKGKSSEGGGLGQI